MRIVRRLRVEPLESRLTPALPSAAPSLGPPPAASNDVIWVSTANQLQNAVQNLQSNQTIVIEPGTYQISAPLYVGLSHPVSNVLIRGATDHYGDVVIRGAGMDNSAVTYGFGFYNAQDVTVANLSVGDVYYDAIDLKGDAGAARIHLYHDRLFDSGEQIIKSNPGGPNGGANDCTVEYCLIEYTNGPSTVDHGPGTGYTNGISAHTVSGWEIRNNLFRNFHTPDNSQYLWNPVVLMWNHSQNTAVEGNTFIDSDRAVALGLTQQSTGHDHQGGVVRNNFVYQRPGLFSASRRAGSDGQIVVYDSPGTQVYHNTVLTSGNSVFSIETRWSNSGVVFSNNLADAPLNARDGGTYTGAGNYLNATPAMFADPANADFHLLVNSATAANVIDHAASGITTTDFDLQPHLFGAAGDIGADEFAPPRVQSTQINDGSAQRSRLTSLTIAFDSPVTFAGPVSAAFSLSRTGGATVAFTATADVVNGVTIVTLANFTGSETESGSLKDGRYSLAALAGQIRVGSAALDGNGDGTPGDDYSFGDVDGLFRMFGDVNGDRHVDIADFGIFATSYGTHTGDGQFVGYLDYNGDGMIDIADFGQFAIRMFTLLP